MKNRIKSWMNYNFKDYIDVTTGELDCTVLAEACADYLRHPEWLDDLEHYVWNCAVDTGELYGFTE